MDRLNETAIAELAALCPGGLERDVNLAEMSWWRIGGRADVFIKPASTEEVANLMSWFADRELQPVVIGMTTNLLFDDSGLRVPCIQIGGRMVDIKISSPIVEAQAGVWVPGLARRLMKAGLGGVEHICGIPGTLGGLVCMNGGSQRKGIGENVVSVTSVDSMGNIKNEYVEDCEFSYRTSSFQTNGSIITDVRLRLVERSPQAIRDDMRSILADRRLKFPRKEPNCGSVFKSNPIMYEKVGPPGAVIEQLGFKGRRIGGAQVSQLHANFIVNVGNATASDVLGLIKEIASGVEKSTGYRMEAEARYVRQDGCILSADQV